MEIEEHHITIRHGEDALETINGLNLMKAVCRHPLSASALLDVIVRASIATGQDADELLHALTCGIKHIEQLQEGLPDEIKRHFDLSDIDINEKKDENK